MIHWPGFPIINNWATNAFVEGLGQAQRRGLTRAVGVSNFSQRRVREAARILSVGPLSTLLPHSSTSCLSTLSASLLSLPLSVRTL